MIALILANSPQAHDLVAGLKLSERVALTATHWGATRVRVVEGPDALAHEPPQGRVLVLWAHVVYDKDLLKGQDWAQDRVWEDASGVVPALCVDAASLDAEALWAMVEPEAFEQLPELAGQGSAERVATGRAVCVVDDASRKEAEARLWASCRKPIDGVVSSSINRHISLFISRRIAHTGITPNHISSFCILVGILAGLVVLQASDVAIVVGAVLLKINSVVDGVDGELARVKWAYSKFGEFLDASGDNVANFSFFGALTWAMWSRGESTFALFGVACLAMWLGHLMFVYAQLYKMKRGDVLLVRQNYDTIDSKALAKIIDVLRYKVLRRDFFVMLTLVMCVLGLYGPLLVIMCVGAAIPFGGDLAHVGIGVFRALRRQPAGA